MARPRAHRATRSAVIDRSVVATVTGVMIIATAIVATVTRVVIGAVVVAAVTRVDRRCRHRRHRDPSRRRPRRGAGAPWIVGVLGLVARAADVGPHAGLDGVAGEQCRRWWCRDGVASGGAGNRPDGAVSGASRSCGNGVAGSGVAGEVGRAGGRTVTGVRRRGRRLSARHRQRQTVGVVGVLGLVAVAANLAGNAVVVRRAFGCMAANAGTARATVAPPAMIQIRCRFIGVSLSLVTPSSVWSRARCQWT